MVTNYENYYFYEQLAKEGTQVVYTKDINDENINKHFHGILNIFKDGIEQEYVQNMYVHIIFTDGVDIDLYISDYFFNLIFWSLTTAVGEPISSDRIFFVQDIKKNYIKKYIDKILLHRHRIDIPFYKLNNIIDDMMDKFKYINNFSMYLMNSLNLEDTIELINTNSEFKATFEHDYSNDPIEHVKAIGMEYAHKQIDIIKNSDHGLKHPFRVGEGINVKQYKEVQTNIGLKPNGQGGVFNYIINKSYIMGGVNDVISYLIDQYGSRVAQILSHMNVGTSGHFARLLELNNIDSFLHSDPNFVCRTKNFIEVTIDSEDKLYAYDMRYYRFDKRGQDILLDADTDKHLIGQTLYFKSPETCASKADGRGICYRCYGNLAYINRDINIGKIAAEILSSILTQMLLSAKHLLEAAVIKMIWPDNFGDFFEICMNTINLIQDVDYSGYKLILYPENIDSDEDEDETFGDSGDFVEYVTSFDIEFPDGSRQVMATQNADEIYLTDELSRLIHYKYKNLDDETELVLDFKDIAVLDSVFWFRIKNKDLSDTLYRAKKIINKSDITNNYTVSGIIKDLIDTLHESGIFISSVHLEVLLSNQIRNIEDVLSMPDWEIPDVEYNILALSTAIMNSPSLTTTLEYQKISQTLINPLSRRKRAKSQYDWYFMEKPQEFISNANLVSDDFVPKSDAGRNITCPVHIIEKDELDVIEEEQ